MNEHSLFQRLQNKSSCLGDTPFSFYFTSGPTSLSHLHEDPVLDYHRRHPFIHTPDSKVSFCSILFRCFLHEKFLYCKIYKHLCLYCKGIKITIPNIICLEYI